MDGDELTADRAQAFARRYDGVRRARAMRLLGECDGDATPAVLKERLRVGWPKLAAVEAKATMELAIQIAGDPTRKGRRLTGAEFEEAARMATTKGRTRKELESTAAKAREFVMKRLRKEPKAQCKSLHAEAVERLGYGGNYHSFYVSVFKKARAAVEAEQATAAENAPAIVNRVAVTGAPATNDAVAQTAAVAARANGNGSHAPAPGVFLLQGIAAERDGRRSRVQVTLYVDGEPNAAVAAVTARLGID